MSQIISTAAKAALAAACGYAVVLAALMMPAVQRELLYLYRFDFLFWNDPKKPETFGFENGQVTPFSIETADHEKLFAWHILHPSRATSTPTNSKAVPMSQADFAHTEAAKLLRNPQSRLIISFHGNAGHVGQMYRPTHLRTLLEGADEDVHVLTFDYRGFAYSGGYPTEDGVVVDGVSVVKWAINDMNITPDRIVLVGHSLGTAVSSAVYHHFHRAGTPLAGLVLMASFTDVPTLLDTYRMGGILPILAPLRIVPSIQRFFANQTADKWQTLRRLQEVARSGRPYNIHLCHAKTDMEIPCQHSFALFNALASGRASYDATAPPKFDGAGARLPSGRTVWKAIHQPDRERCVQLTLFLTGFHNELIKFTEIAAFAQQMLPK